MKRIAAVLVAAFLVAFSAGLAVAQTSVPDISGHSCYQAPSAEPAAGGPVIQFGSLGWDPFLASHASRLLLTIARWQPAQNRLVMPARVRVPSAPARVTR